MKTLPLLVFYVVIVLVRHDVFPKDEITYMAYAALENIADHPGKFARNWSHNVQRMLIDAPYSYRESLTFWKFGVPNTLLILLILRGISRRRGSPWTRPRKLAPIAGFVATYLAGTSLINA